MVLNVYKVLHIYTDISEKRITASKDQEIYVYSFLQRITEQRTKLTAVFTKVSYFLCILQFFNSLYPCLKMCNYMIL